MKQLDPKEIEEVAGALDTTQYETQVAPEPQSDPVVDYNPDRTPK